MFFQAKTQDLLLQNQSMRLVEDSIDPSNLYAVELAKVRYLQSMLPTPIVGTAGVVAMFYFLGLPFNHPFDMMVWLVLGSSATAWRIFFFFRYRNIFSEQPLQDVLQKYLQQTTLIAAISGITFGWGWLKIYANLSPEIQMGFLFTNIVMLFGALYAYSPHLWTYFSFSLFSLGPALWKVHEISTLWIAQSVGISLVVIVSQMFAFRWAQNFRHNVLLLDRNAKLFNELTEKKEYAEKATLAKSRFLASASHDLRQPLHAINLYLAVLRRSLEADTSNNMLDDGQQQITNSSLQHLQDSAIQLTRMFEALLDISKLDAELTQANIAPIGVSEMINQLAKEYSHVSAQAGLTFDVQLPENFEQIHVLADAIILERILRNLLTNATTHVIHGGVRLHLKVKHSNEGVRLDFRVIDTGPGINSFDRAKIFEEFYQTDSAKKRASKGPTGISRNLGLGLAISSRLATLLKTRIRLHSYLGKGSVFAFDLAMQFQKKSTKKSNILDTRIKPDFNRLRLQDVSIAVIDDEPNILLATKQLLKIYGANVLTAENSIQTWQAIQHFGKAPDIFLVDHGLGSESGSSLIQTIHEIYGANKPCILITGDTSAEQVAKFSQEKQQVLYKPITDGMLIQAIVMALRRPPYAH